MNYDVFLSRVTNLVGHYAIKASLDRGGAAQRRSTTLGRSGPSLEESPSLVQN